MPTTTERLRAIAASVAPRAVELRRQIHRRPELGDQEFETTSLIARALEDAGVDVTHRDGKTGLVADVGEAGTMVSFRADLDALPITELTGLPYASEIPGMMHACGHDAHAAIGVGVALALHQLTALPGRARVLFQPAEETFPGGAQDMVSDGYLDGVRAIMAFHVDPTLPAGMVGIKAGPITSSSDRVHITIEGPGGHTARPHETVDTVYAAARVVSDLPTLLHRRVDARTPLSLVFGQIHGGASDNVIPTTVDVAGTCRLLDRALWDIIPSLVESLVQDIIAPYGAKAIVHYQRGIPPVVNDSYVLAEIEYAAAETLGTEAVTGTHASMGAEDFSRFLEVTPGALVRLGAKLGNRMVDLHSASFDIDERALETGILVATASLLRLMAAPRLG